MIILTFGAAEGIASRYSIIVGSNGLGKLASQMPACYVSCSPYVGDVALQGFVYPYEAVVVGLYTGQLRPDVVSVWYPAGRY